MYVASKYLDCYPLAMQIVYDKIGHQAFPVETIKLRERELLLVLDFDIMFPTVLEFIENEVTYLIVANYAPTAVKRLQNLCIFLAKMICYEYRFLEYRYL